MIVLMTNVFDSSFPWTESVKVMLLPLKFPRLKSELCAIANATCSQSFWSEEPDPQTSGDRGGARGPDSLRGRAVGQCCPLASHTAGDLVLAASMTNYTPHRHEVIHLRGSSAKEHESKNL